MIFSSLAIVLHFLTPHFSFPEGAGAAEFIILRWLHFVFGIIWIGLLYFFNLVGFPTMKQLDASVRGKVDVARDGLVSLVRDDHRGGRRSLLFPPTER
jgi:hypothetical protein